MCSTIYRIDISSKSFGESEQRGRKFLRIGVGRGTTGPNRTPTLSIRCRASPTTRSPAGRCCATSVGARSPGSTCATPIPELMRAAQCIGDRPRRRVPRLRREQPAARHLRVRRQAESGERPCDQHPRRAREARRDVRRVRVLRRRGVSRVPVEPPAAPVTARTTPRELTSRSPQHDLAGVLARRSRCTRARVRAPPSRSRAGPTLGDDVDAPHEHELVVGEPAVLARAFGHSVHSRPLATVGYPAFCRREPNVPWTVEVPEMTASRGANDRARRREPARASDTPLVMVTAYDAPIGTHGRRCGRRHDPRRRHARDGRARLRRHVASHDRRHGASRRRGCAYESTRARRRRPAVAQLSREHARDGAQRGAA